MDVQIDTLYKTPLDTIGGFIFDESVAQVFPDMITRSVPGYGVIVSAIGLMARHFAKEHSICYDLGCSLGAATMAMRQQIATDNCCIVAVDSSKAMVERCKVLLDKQQSSVPVQVLCQDIRQLAIERASVVVLNFTLQFIPVADRLELLETIYNGLLPGGILILSEKLMFADPQQQALQTEMHHAFKKAQGYSELEISQKRSALENVLIPETLIQHQHRLQQAGFSNAETWFQYFNFASILAIKNIDD